MGVNNETKRCAIYTRKSTEDGLELKYNSLDAQYDSCAAYIRSQEGMGWSLVEKRYDDGGFSGGNTRRPGLTELISDIEAGLIDAVVVYKIDRLSRSLSDFADLFRIFEKHHVSFVSITQQIDTSNAAGRMMLNILMSFAQFEREMSSDRIRDKIYETKKKGMWVGGGEPYGYVVKDKQLVLEPVAARGIEFAFNRYLEIGSTLAVAKELNATHPRNDGVRWSGRNVLTVLRNPLYEGFVVSKRTNEIFKGVHEPIVSTELFKSVQKVIDETASVQSGSRRSLLAPLKGILRCGTCGSAMSPAYSSYHGNKKRRYTYYRCSKSIKSSEDKCGLENLSGEAVEKFVFAQLEDVLRRDDVLAMIGDGDPERKDVLLDELDDMGKLWDRMLIGERDRIFHLLLNEVRVWRDRMEITFRIDGEAKRSVPCNICNDSGRTRIRTEEEVANESDGTERGIAKMFRKTHAWLELLTSGTYPSKKELARALGVSGTYITRTLRLQFISPDLVEKIMKGECSLSIEKISRVTSLIWEDQNRELKV